MDELVASGSPRASMEQLDAPSNAPLLKIIGEVDLSTVDALRASIERVVASSPERITFDLNETSFMDSSGIAMLLAVADRIGDVELRNAKPVIRKIIELTGLAAVFRVTP